MGYLLIRVHSFSCDTPGCTAEEEHTEPYKADAWVIMMRGGWTLRSGKVFCPQHSGES